MIIVKSASAAPSGAAGGALDGTYPNPGLAAAVAGAGLAETSDVLSVNVDGSSIEINSDTLRVKAGGITNAMLASPDVGVYSRIHTNAARATTAAGSGTTYFMQSVGSDISTLQVNVQNGTSFVLLHIVAADYAVAGLTTKLMMRAVIPTGGTAPNVTCTVGLYPITVAAGSFAIGTLVTNSGTAVATPSTNVIATGTSGDFDIPADGVYGLAYIVSGTPSANFDIYAHLYAHHV